MKPNIKKILIALALLIVKAVPAQELDERDSNYLGNGIYILPTQLIFPEITLTYEHFIKERLSVSYSLGYKIPTGEGNTLEPFGSGLFANYELSFMFNEFSNALYISIAPSYYFGSRRKYFVQCEFFNRFYWFDDKRLSFDNVEKYWYNSIRSERVNATGIKALVGLNSKLSISKSMFFNIKLYWGIGVRYKNYYYENIDNKKMDPDLGEIIYPYEEERGSMFTPSFHLGLKIGMAKKVSIIHK
jgi:hypothetical protein